MSENTSPLCIYHGNCADGFGAAWVVRKVHPDADFHPGVYGQEPPDVAGRDVIIVDFSYPRETLLRMARSAKSILIIDHHKTAMADLNGLTNAGGIESCPMECVFDMERSGAMLTWDWFFPHEEPPALLRHIEDRDLWRFNLPNTREIQANVFSYPYDFAVWDELMVRPVIELVAEGRAIERKHLKDVAELTGVTQRRMVIGGLSVPVANLPYTLVSDAASHMAAGEPFAGCYWDTPRGRVFGLRSVPDGGLDVSDIAKLYGGGGHKHAAGFTVPTGWEGDGMPRVAMYEGVKHGMLLEPDDIRALADWSGFTEFHEISPGDVNGVMLWFGTTADDDGAPPSMASMPTTWNALKKAVR